MRVQHFAAELARLGPAADDCHRGDPGEPKAANGTIGTGGKRWLAGAGSEPTRDRAPRAAAVPAASTWAVGRVVRAQGEGRVRAGRLRGGRPSR